MGRGGGGGGASFAQALIASASEQAPPPGGHLSRTGIDIHRLEKVNGSVGAPISFWPPLLIDTDMLGCCCFCGVSRAKPFSVELLLVLAFHFTHTHKFSCFFFFFFHFLFFCSFFFLRLFFSFTLGELPSKAIGV